MSHNMLFDTILMLRVVLLVKVDGKMRAERLTNVDNKMTEWPGVPFRVEREMVDVKFQFDVPWIASNSSSECG